MLAGTGRASLTSARLGASRTLVMIFSSQKKNNKILTWDANPHVGGRSNKDLFYLFCRGCPEFCSAVGSDITYTAAAPCVCSSLSLLWSPTSTSLHPLIAKDSLVTTDAGCQQISTLQSAGEDNSLGPRLRLWDATAAQALQQ